MAPTLTEPHRAPRPAAVRPAVAGLALAMLLSSLGTSVANVALPTLQRSFGASFGQVQWIVLAYLLAITTLVVGAGRLGDVVGRRRLLLAGIAVFTVASALCALAPTLWLLVAARAAQGAGAAVMMALAVALVTETVGPGRTGSAVGLLGTTSAVGTALGPSLGGVVIAGAGWRAVFLINVPLGLVAFGLVRRHLAAAHVARRGVRAAVDVPGTLLLAVALAAYALAVTAGGAGGVTVALLAVAAAAAALLVAVEARAPSPLIRAALLRQGVLGRGLAMSALVSTVMMATLVVGPFHLARGLGLGTALVGLVMSVGPAVVVLSGVPAGRLADRVGAGPVATWGLLAMTGGAALLAAMPARAGVPGYVGPMVVVTLGYALFQTANTTLVMREAPGPERGAVSGMLNLSRNLGLITGASVMGAVFALAAGTAEVATAAPAAVVTGTRTTFAVAAALVAVALAVALTVRRGRPPAAPADR